MKKAYLVGLLVQALVGISLVGCSSAEKKEAAEAGPTAEAAAEGSVFKPAQATIEPRSGNKKVQGTVQFVPEADGIRVIANIEGLKPNTNHGFHIHEKGDCSAPDASSAGGHFNPDGVAHASPGDKESHVGDMGNIKADRKGHGHIEKVFPRMSLNSRSFSNILGKSVVIHAKPDDMKSQPAGNAGDRIGCGVIAEVTL